MRWRTDPAIAVATLGGLGVVRWAPGTWGSAVGAVLGLLTAHAPMRSAVVWAVLTFLVCAWLCGLAERRLRRHDPPAVILDEVWGMWFVVVALPWLAAPATRPWLLAAFLLFRAFDIVKPLPLPALARLPGGLGIMADDLGAAVYTILSLTGVNWLMHFGF
jgi:phosphatidylglycerophosphatase A